MASASAGKGRERAYHPKFSANANANAADAVDADEYLTELDEPTWRTLKIGKRYRLTVGLLSDEVKQDEF